MNILKKIFPLFLILAIGFSAQFHASARELPVYDIKWSPDGNRIAVARMGEIVQLLDATTLDVLITLSHPQVTTLAWSPDSARLATGGWDNTLRIWDTNTGQLLTSIEVRAEPMTGIEWTSDGAYIISTGLFASFSVWDATTYQFVRSFTGGGYQFDLNLDDTLLANASGKVSIENFETGETIAVLEGHEREALCVEWSPDGTQLVSGGADGTVRIWDATTYQQTMLIQAHDGNVAHVTWSRDGNYIASVGGNEAILWDAKTGEPLATLEHSTGGIAWSPDGTQFALNDSDGVIKIVALSDLIDSSSTNESESD
jgi:WD40 repeat protein